VAIPPILIGTRASPIREIGVRGLAAAVVSRCVDSPCAKAGSGTRAVDKSWNDGRDPSARGLFVTSAKRCPMSDDKSEPGAVANSDDDEAVQFVARRYGLNRRDARKLVARVGNDRERLNQEARKLTRTETKAPSDNL